jgi:hypothetical protein
MKYMYGTASRKFIACGPVQRTSRMCTDFLMQVLLSKQSVGCNRARTLTVTFSMRHCGTDKCEQEAEMTYIDL